MDRGRQYGVSAHALDNVLAQEVNKPVVVVIIVVI